MPGIEGFRLSPQQRHLWLLQQASPCQPFHAGCMILIEGDLDRAALGAAIERVVSRHELLRTTFQSLPGMPLPLQVISGDARVPADSHDLAGLDPQEQAAQAQALFQDLLRRPFDTKRGPLLCTSLVGLAPRRHLLLVSMPALCADTASLANLARELGAAYAATHQEHDLDEPVQYVDVAEWQNELLESEETEEGRDYWRGLDLAALPTLRLPFQRRPGVPAGAEPQVVAAPLPADTTARIDALARRHETTAALVCLACWQILLRRLGGQPEIIVAAAHAGRKYDELERTLGLCAMYLPIAARLEEQDSFAACLEQARAAWSQAAMWQEYFSWEDAGAATRRGDRPSFFPYHFEFEAPVAPFVAGGLSFSLEQRYARIDRFEIKLACARQGDGLMLEFHYDPGACAEGDIRRLAGQFQALAAGATAHPDAAIGDLDLLSDSELRQLLVEFNDTGVAHPHVAGIHQLFEAQAQRVPDRVAVVFEERRLTYAALNARANQLAHHLLAHGVGPEVPVAICLARSPDLIVALLAVLKAGGAYVPLDPDYPPERLLSMMEDARVAVLLTNKEIGDWRLEIGAAEQSPISNLQSPTVVYLDTDWETIAQQPATNPDAVVMPEHLAYVLFTSGSTGRPKGVAVEHRQLANYLHGIVARLGLPAGASFATVSTIAADLGNTAIFPALCGGGCLHLIAQARAADADALAGYFQRNPVDCLKIVPAHLAALLACAQPQRVLPRKRLVLGGEALGWELVDAVHTLAPDCRILNHYGPTETTVGVLTYAVERGAADRHSAGVPLGRPLANTQLFILDPRGRPAPLGVPGELHIGGAGVARGYLGRPDLTADRFVPNPFAEGRLEIRDWRLRGVDAPISNLQSPISERLYKTGDLCRYRDDGTIEYLGRADDQLKLRGFRVEPGEIAAVLRQHGAVQDAAVVAGERGPGQQRLVAYVVPDLRVAFPLRQLLRFENQGLLDERALRQLPNDMVVGHLNPNETDALYHEIFEAQTYLRHGVALEPGACIFDVGANIGLFSLFAGRRYGDATIYAFEPLPPIFEVLRLNAALYGLNARLFNCGLAGEAGRATFAYYPHASVMSGRYADADAERAVIKAFVLNQQRQERGGPPGEELLDELIAERLASVPYRCELRTISDVMREHGVERIDLLKIDVQKSELEVLDGIETDDWPKIRQIVIEVHDIDDRLETITALLRGHGYDLAVEQAALLAGTAQYDIYATRPGMERRHAPADEPAPVWSSAGRLVEDLRRFAVQRLPDYMLPAVLVLLDALPLTPNGKLDRRALPEPPPEGAGQERPLLAPRTTTEQMLAEIWGRLLGLERVGADQHFFTAGGHSLLATQLVARIRAAFQVELPLHAIFERPVLADLAAQIDALAGAAHALQALPIVRVPRAGDSATTPSLRRDSTETGPGLPISLTQQGMWFLDRIAHGNAFYTMTLPVRVAGPLDRAALQQALDALARRHEVLRTTLPQVGGRAVQVITPVGARGGDGRAFHETPLPLIDLGALPAAERAAVARRLAAQDAGRPFDLERGPLLRAALLRLGAAEHVVLLAMHHIISDGWSLRVIARELAALYAAGSAPLPDLPIQYADYALWQREWLQGAVREQLLDYWRRQLDGAPRLLALPTDRPRPAAETYRGASQTFVLPPTLAASLQALTHQAGGTLFMTLLAAFQVLLSRYSGQDDFVVGTPIAGRTRAETEGLIGLFLNTLALRADLSGDPTFLELLGRVRETCLGAYAHQDLPFDQLVEALRPERDLSHNPLFQVMCTLQNIPAPQVELPGLELSLLEVDGGTAKFDLLLALMDTADGLYGQVEYNVDLFDAATIGRMIGHFETLLAAIAMDPALPVSRLPVLTQAERRQLLVEWNATAAEIPSACAHQLFEAQAARTPDAVALLFDDRRPTTDDRRPPNAEGERGRGGEGETGQVTQHATRNTRHATRKRLTYAELNEQANRLAHHLRSLGVGPDVLVGICMERSPNLVVALLAVLKAGGAYLPLDPGYPAERLRSMLEDAQVAVLLTSREIRDWRLEIVAAPQSPISNLQSLLVIAIDAEWEQIARQPATNPDSGVTPDNLAYVIYTSGSTGAPKGVMISHGGLVHSTTARRHTYATPPGRFLWLSSVAFDSSVAGLFWTLAEGGALVLPPADRVADPKALAALIEREQVSHLLCLPALYALVLEAAAPARLRTLGSVVVAGESCPPTLVPEHYRQLPEAALFNEYGPTEATVWSTVHRCRSVEAGAQVPIGRPIANAQAYLLDRHLNPVPVGVPGELYIGGAGLARGYLGRPDLTAERFIPNPFAQERLEIRDWRLTPSTISNLQSPISNRLYRTGDLCRYRPDGAIEFLGRLDHQVKLRGFRIELDEVAAVLSAHPGVREALVVAREDRPGGRRLVAYVVPRDWRLEIGDSASDNLQSPISNLPQELRQFLADRLPDYMIPSAFVLLDGLPLTPNGKVDRAALPAPDGARAGAYAGPRTPAEATLAELAARMLGVERVGIHDNFFMLGGHSLLATQYVAQLSELFQVELPLRSVFETPTVAGMAEQIEALQWAAQDAPVAAGAPDADLQEGEL